MPTFVLSLWPRDVFRRCSAIGFLATIILGLPRLANAQLGRAFALSDWYHLTTVSGAALSPDGRWVAMTVTTVREAENKRHSEIWVAATDGGEPMRFTSPSLESSSPRWSPDGNLLLFTSARPGSKGKTWALRMDKPSGEAMEVDSLPVGSYARKSRVVVWSDTMESATVDSLSKGPYDKMVPMARPPLNAITRPLDPARFDGRHITEMTYKSNDQGYLPGPRVQRSWKARQLWLRALDGGSKKQLTDTRYSHAQVAVSPDGGWIAFTADPALRPDSVVQAERDSLARLPYDAKRDETPRNQSDIFVLSSAGGEPRRLTSQAGDETNLEWSPDGSALTFIARLTRTSSARLFSVSADGAKPINLLGSWTYEPEWYTWQPSGQILFAAAVGGRTAIFALDPRSRDIREIVGGRRRLGGTTADAEGRKLAFVVTSLTQPTELFVASADGSGERQVSHFNDKVNSEIAWSDAERFTYRSVGNLEIEAWLMRPFGYVAGKKYPLVLYIHGGPHAAYGENWFDEFQNLAAAGMWVLFTNPRGSSGYGADFTYATRGRWGAEDYEDLMKAVDQAVQRPGVDSARLGVAGGSYGGFMTAWITTKTNRFKAAQSDRMISNWWSWYGGSDAQGLTEFEFYGKPWENPAIYDSLSPMHHVSRVRTPTLLVQSEEDYRAPIPDAEQWFMALQKRGVPVEFVRYPRSTHELSRSGEPWLLVDRLGRLRQWFEHWLK